jgi:hypothetical protein
MMRSSAARSPRRSCRCRAPGRGARLAAGKVVDTATASGEDGSGTRVEATTSKQVIRVYVPPTSTVEWGTSGTPGNPVPQAVIVLIGSLGLLAALGVAKRRRDRDLPTR